MTNISTPVADSNQFPEQNDTPTGPQIALDFIKLLFEHADDRVFLTSLGNERDGTHEPKDERPRDDDDTLSFVETWDRPERGMFFCVSTIKGQRRNKQTVSELPMLFADIDLKDVGESVESIEKKLLTLVDIEGKPFPPSVMVRSGYGLHAYWIFNEPISIRGNDEMKDRIEGALRILADLVAGDLQVCEVARLMRLPGSHNSKRDEWKDVVVSHEAPVRYELSDLEEMLAVKSPIILRKIREVGKTAGQADETDPYLRYFKENGIKTAIDVKARLDQMMFMGGEGAAVHKTQVDVAASMVAKGYKDEEIVSLILVATKAAAGDYGRRWNWDWEERTIRKDLAKVRVKFSKDGKPIEPKPRPDDQPTRSNVTSMVDGANALKAKAEEKDPKPKSVVTSLDDEPLHIKIGRAVIGVVQGRGDALLFTERAFWYCEGGLWRMMTDGDTWLNVEIEKAFVAFKLGSNNKQRAEVRGWIKCQHQLVRRFEDIRWDAHGMVPTLSGLVDPRTLEVRPIRPEDYCTWRVEAEYDPAATCPWWLTMLNDVFADQPDEERADIIRVIQELAGAGLIDDKPRELSRALVFQGGSNFGKSGLITVLAGLFGKDVNSTTIEALEGAHGKMNFLKRVPWVLHEAFDQRKWHFSSDTKTLITGEPIHINIKNGPMLSVCFRGPIFWGTNHPPQFKEATKAIANRLVIIECKREFFDDAPVGAALEARKRGLGKPQNLILKEELPGVLTWALAGLKRALERGMLLLTKPMTDALEDIHRDANLVAGFLEECVFYDEDKRISVPDFCLAFAAWWLQNKGENRQVPSNEVIGKALQSMADPMIAIDAQELRDNARRYYAGIVLNEEGLAFHHAASEMPDLKGKTANATEPKGVVNQPLPAQWLDKVSIKAMQERQARGGDSGAKPLFPE